MSNSHSEKCFISLDVSMVCPTCISAEKHRDASALPRGTLLDNNFRVGHLLGEPGGFGIAYLCWDIAMNTEVAIKELFPRESVYRVGGGDLNVVAVNDRKQKEFSIQREEFLKEVRTLASINHPAVVRIKHFFSANNTAYFVMDYCPGRSLAEIIDNRGGISYNEMIDLLWPIMGGLREVHSLHILHRDIKPENILITEEGRPILLDFGNAKPKEGSTNSGFIGISPHFSPPELYANNISEMGDWTDVYALCSLMYYCITGERPVDAKPRTLAEPDDILKPIESFGEDIPELIKSIISKGMDLQRKNRYQSVQDVQVALRPFRPVVGSYVWQENINDDRLGENMKIIQSAISHGKGFPLLLSPAAAIFQWFWLFSHRLTKYGILSSLIAIFAALILAYDYDFWPYSAVIIFFNGLMCGFFGLSARYHYVDHWAKSQPVRTPQEIIDTTDALTSLGHPNYLRSLMGVVVLCVFILAVQVREIDEERTRYEVASALSLTGLRERLSDFYAKSAGAIPTLETIGYVFEEDDEVKMLTLNSYNITVTFAFNPVRGKQVRLFLTKDLKWKCINVTLPLKFIPRSCRKNN